MITFVKDLIELKRMDRILDLVRDEKVRREEEARKVLMEMIENEGSELPMLYKSQVTYGYDEDLRPFIRAEMPIKSDKEVIESIMKYLDDKVKMGVELEKIHLKIKREGAA